MTSFSIEIPAPAGFKASRVSYHDLPSGTHLHRIHPTRFGATQFNDTDLGNARFSPIRRPDDVIIPTIYAAQTFPCAVGETILRCPDYEPIDPSTGHPVMISVRPHKWRGSAHSMIRTARDLRLVDLSTKGQRRIGINRNALLAGPTSTYPATRAWAEAIHAGCPDAQGFYYTSHQFGPDFAVVLFGDRVVDPFEATTHQRLVSGYDCDRDIRALADTLEITYEDL